MEQARPVLVAPAGAEAQDRGAAGAEWAARLPQARAETAYARVAATK